MRRHLMTTVAVASLFLGTFALPIPNTRAATATTQPTAKTGLFEKVKSALEQLDLTSKQKEKIKGILEVASGKLKDLRGESATPDKEKARVIVKTALEQIGSTLTAEQKTKFKELMKSEKA